MTKTKPVNASNAKTGTKIADAAGNTKAKGEAIKQAVKGGG